MEVSRDACNRACVVLLKLLVRHPQNLPSVLWQPESQRVSVLRVVRVRETETQQSRRRRETERTKGTIRLRCAPPFDSVVEP